MSSSGFSEEAMRSKLNKLSGQAESIQTLSLWVLHHQRHHSDAILNVWLKEMRRLSNSSRLVNLIYLANDIIQNARKKAPELMTKFHAVLEPAFRHCSKLPAPDLDRAITKVLKVFKDRQIYTEQQIIRLEDAAHGKKIVVNQAPTEIYGSASKAISPETNYDSEAVSSTVEETLKSLKKVELPPSADAEIRHKLADYPEAVGNPQMLESIKNGAEVDDLLLQIAEVEPLAIDYCKKLADEMLERRNLQKLLDSLLSNVRATVDHQERLLKEVKRKEEKVKMDLIEVQRAHQSLPDLTEITSGNPLPAAESLFDCY